MKNQFLFDYPLGPGPFPAVIIAPGIRYPMDGSIFKELVRIFVEKGLVVARLNWFFYLEDPVTGMPSENLQTELAELRALSATLRMDKRVNATQIFVLGKSLGSVIAWRAFCADKDLLGAILLTPLCATEEEKHYPLLATEARPVLLIAGDNDPHCKLALVNQLAIGLGGKTALKLVAGNHNLELSGAMCQQNGQSIEDLGIAFRRKISALAMSIYAWIDASLTNL
ncbi:dienelactone hydrolase family protein [Undibacterium sp. SXout11W]|uniref:dienelactone hydrolase family protein n=1 Tax=Undibacterium sp. SXout11W TaxID=3413050 RepID=UPI003BEFFA81